MGRDWQLFTRVMLAGWPCPQPLAIPITAVTLAIGEVGTTRQSLVAPVYGEGNQDLSRADASAKAIKPIRVRASSFQGTNPCWFPHHDLTFWVAPSQAGTSSKCSSSQTCALCNSHALQSCPHCSGVNLREELLSPEHGEPDFPGCVPSLALYREPSPSISLSRPWFPYQEGGCELS